MAGAGRVKFGRSQGLWGVPSPHFSAHPHLQAFVFLKVKGFAGVTSRCFCISSLRLGCSPSPRLVNAYSERT